MIKSKSALFVSYNAATGPLVRSQVLPYLTALSKDGIKIHLLSFEKGAEHDADTSRIIYDAGIDWIKLRFHSKPMLMAKLFDIKLGSIVTLWTCMTKKIGVVHARGIMGALVSIIPAKITGAKFIFDMKSSLAEAYRLNGRITKESVMYNAIVFLERVVFFNSDEVVVETREHKRELEKLAASGRRIPEISVLPCCVDVERFREKKNHAYISGDGRIKIVYLGSLSGWYMLPEMLDLFTSLRNARPNSEFLFLSEDKEGLVERIAKEKGLDGIVIKKVCYEDVPKNLWGATAGILFKRPNERLDSFPIKIAEYLAAGLPIIINSGMGDVEEMVIKNRVGVVVASAGETSYKKAIEELSSLIEEGSGLQKRCESVASGQLSSDFGLSVYSEIYRRLVSKGAK